MRDNDWAQQFLDLLPAAGLRATAIHRVNGWIEEVVIGRYRCFVKSMSYHHQRRLYFLGVDPDMLRGSFEIALLCCGDRSTGSLSDIFTIPWTLLAATASKAEPINTYRDRYYSQFKAYLRNRDGAWTLSFQGGDSPTVQVNQFRHSTPGAMDVLRG